MIFYKNLGSKAVCSKGGVSVFKVPKIQAFPGGGGGSDLCLDFFEGFVHMH